MAGGGDARTRIFPGEALLQRFISRNICGYIGARVLKNAPFQQDTSASQVVRLARNECLATHPVGHWF
jgi:hypothetical protein